MYAREIVVMTRPISVPFYELHGRGVFGVVE